MESSDSEDQNFWPGYVDAISNLVLSLLFVTMVLAMALVTSSQVSKVKVSDQNSEKDLPEKKEYKLEEEAQELEQLKLKLQSELKQLREKNIENKSVVQKTQQDPQKTIDKTLDAPGVQFLEVVFQDDAVTLAFPEDVNLRNTIRGLGGDPIKWFYNLEVSIPPGDRQLRKQAFARMTAVRNQLQKIGVPLHLLDMHVLEVTPSEQPAPTKVQLSRIAYKWGEGDSAQPYQATLEDPNKVAAQELQTAVVEVRFNPGLAVPSDSEIEKFRTESRKLGADFAKGRYQLKALVQGGSASARRTGFFRLSAVREQMVRLGVPFDSVDVHVAETSDLTPEDAVKVTVTRTDQPQVVPAAGVAPSSPVAVPDANKASNQQSPSMEVVFRSDATTLSDQEKDAFKKAAFSTLGSDLSRGRFQIRARFPANDPTGRRVVTFRVTAIREQLLALGVPSDLIDLNLVNQASGTATDAAKLTVVRLQ